MNLTIIERYGGGFCIELQGDVAVFIDRPEPSHLSGGDRAYAESDTLTLRFGSHAAPMVTFKTFDDLRRVFHGDLRLSPGE